MRDEKYLLSSVSNALDILDALSKTQVMGVADLSKQLNLGKSSVFRLLYTLKSKGYVIQDSSSKYMLGNKFSYYGSIVNERQNEFTLIHPTLIELKKKTSETVHLGILLANNNLMFIDKIPSDYKLQMNSKIGYELPSYASGCGKAILAELIGTPRGDSLKSIKFEKFTNNTITSYSQLVSSLKQIKEQGYSIDDEESEIGLTCLAVPIKSSHGREPIAISVSGSTPRIRLNFDIILKSLQETAKEVKEILAY